MVAAMEPCMTELGKPPRLIKAFTRGAAGGRLAQVRQALLPTSMNSMTPSRAFFTRGVSVLMFIPGAAGIAHEATGLGLLSTCDRDPIRNSHLTAGRAHTHPCLRFRPEPKSIPIRQEETDFTSTRHILQLPAIDKR